jgi:hypothetical protein
VCHYTRGTDSVHLSVPRHSAYHFTSQIAEFFVYFLLGIGVPGIAIWVLMSDEWKENQRRYPPGDDPATDINM